MTLMLLLWACTSSPVAAGATDISSRSIVRKYNFKGTIEGYPITMWMTCCSDSPVPGRYCYDRMVEKYGEGRSHSLLPAQTTASVGGGLWP